MAKPELGGKRVCVACGARFYDLRKAPAVCPKCGAEQPAEQPRLRRGAGNVTEDKRAKKPQQPADEVEQDLEVPEADVDEDVLEDATDLEDEDEALDDDLDVRPSGEEG